MASFGRRPQKNSSADGWKRPTAVGGASSQSSSGGLRRMQEEEEERERFAKEHSKKSEGREKVAAPRGRASRSRSGKRKKRPDRNPHVFLDVEIRGKLNGKVRASGRLEFELFANTVPKTAENFRCLCTGERGKDLQFVNCMFHHIVPGLLAAAGDITAGDGTGGRSIYGKTFADEGFDHGHDDRGILSMSNRGPDTNGSRFFVLLKRASNLDGKHVAFGKMIRDEKTILESIEKSGSNSGKPDALVSIVSCGEVSSDGREARQRSRSKSPSGRPEPPRMSGGLRVYGFKRFT